MLWVWLIFQAPICHLECDITVCVPSHKTGPIVAKGLHSCHLEISPTIERAWKAFWECKDDERNSLQDDATECLKRCHILILNTTMYEKQTVWKRSLPESWDMLSYLKTIARCFAGITSDWISLEKDSGKTILPASLSSPASHLLDWSIHLRLNCDSGVEKSVDIDHKNQN